MFRPTAEVTIVHDQRTELGAEEAAVMDVIAMETAAFFGKDFETVSRCWVHAPYVRRLGWWTRGGVSDVYGWATLSALTKAMMEEYPEPNGTAQIVQRTNVVVRVMGDMAWATFDQIGPDTGEADVDMPGVSREARVLEKHDGEWRIVYLTFVLHNPDVMKPATFRVDRNRAVRSMNEAAEVVIGQKNRFVVSQGKLRAINRSEDGKLKQAVETASDGDAIGIDGSRAVIPIVLDAAGTEARCICWVATAGTDNGAVIVSLNDLTLAHERIVAARAAFGLSTSQQLLVEHIVAGRDLVSAAERLGITVNTAKTQLQRIFEKTGVRSQTALVRVLLNVQRPE